MLKINVAILVDFLKKIKMENPVELTDIKLNFSDKGLEVTEFDISQTVFVNGLLNKDVFVEYESIGELGIGDIKSVIAILNKFKEVELIKDNNKLIIKENSKKVTFELLDLSFLKQDVPKLPVFDFTSVLNLEENSLNKFINDASINGSFNIIFDCNLKEKEIRISNSGKYKFSEILKNDKVNQDISLNFGMPFVGAVSNLTNEVVLSIGKDIPVRIDEETEHSKISIVVAPLVKDEDNK